MLLAPHDAAHLARCFDVTAPSVQRDAALVQGWRLPEAQLYRALERRHAWATPDPLAVTYVAWLRWSLTMTLLDGPLPFLPLVLPPDTALRTPPHRSEAPPPTE